MPAAGLGHLAGGAGIFQEDLGQVSGEGGPGRQGEAQHPCTGPQAGPSARAARAGTRPGPWTRSQRTLHGLLAGAGQTVGDRGRPRLQDVFLLALSGAQVAEATWGRASRLRASALGLLCPLSPPSPREGPGPEAGPGQGPRSPRDLSPPLQGSRQACLPRPSLLEVGTGPCARFGQFGAFLGTPWWSGVRAHAFPAEGLVPSLAEGELRSHKMCGMTQCTCTHAHICTQIHTRTHV